MRSKYSNIPYDFFVGQQVRSVDDKTIGRITSFCNIEDYTEVIATVAFSTSCADFWLTDLLPVSEIDIEEEERVSSEADKDWYDW